jgi:hypothetical protein
MDVVKAILFLLGVFVLSMQVCADISGDYEYTNNGDGTCTITGYTGPGGDVTIPDSLNGLTVTSIGNYAFRDNDNLTSVMIPDSVATIGDHAFYNCSAMASVDLGSSVTSIGQFAFLLSDNLTIIEVDANNLVYSSLDGILFNKLHTELVLYPKGRTGAYTIPDSVITIRERAFYYCSVLTSVMIPDSVTTIGELAFSHCDDLTSVVIGNSVSTINISAFRDCSALTCVTFGNTVTSIGSWAFYRCFDLRSLYFKGDAPGLGGDVFKYVNNATVYYIPETVGWGATYGGLPTAECQWSLIDENIICDNGDTTCAILCNHNSGGDVTIPDTLNGLTVTSIGNHAFRDNDNLTSVIISESVTTIGDWAFRYCSNLASVTIGNGVTTIGYAAFANCYALTSVEIGNSVTTIGANAFYECDVLTNVVLGNSVAVIGDTAFSKCSSLVYIVFPDSVTTIGGGAFSCSLGLTCLYFKGDAPELISEFDCTWGLSYPDATVYYLQGTTGWGPTFGGLPTAEWALSIADLDMDGEVNLWDFAVFAAAWDTVDGVDAAYDPLCDISDPVDGVIDIADLDEFTFNWLLSPCE